MSREVLNFFRTSKNDSRARGIIEYIFRILVARWRIYYSTVFDSVENRESYVLTTITLCNCPRLTYNAVYTSVGFTDSKALLDGEIQPCLEVLMM